MSLAAALAAVTFGSAATSAQESIDSSQAAGQASAARVDVATANPRDTAEAPPLIDRSLLLDYLADTDTFTLLDARSEQEFATGHIYGAVNIPHDALDEFAAALPTDLDAPLVVYCKTGLRAARLQEQLSARGYTRVRVLGPKQLVWSDTAPMFNCGVPAPAEPPSLLPASQ